MCIRDRVSHLEPYGSGNKTVGRSRAIRGVARNARQSPSGRHSGSVGGANAVFNRIFALLRAFQSPCAVSHVLE
eukprot:5675691-Alexandrium_andersonii.AAC.1